MTGLHHTRPVRGADLVEDLHHDHCVSGAFWHGSGDVSLDQVDAIGHTSVADGLASRFYPSRVDVHVNASSFRESLG